MGITGDAVIIRRAARHEAGALSRLAMRSKASWGYDTDFMERCRPELTVSEAQVMERPTYVAAAGDEILGFVALAPLEDEPGACDVAFLFVDPDHIGRGIGRALWRRMVRAATRGGAMRIVIESDPSAEGFYARMGATRVGDRPSPIDPARRLPVLSYDL